MAYRQFGFDEYFLNLVPYDYVSCVKHQPLTVLQYLVSDLDKEDEDEDHEQVADDADTSDDAVDDLECKVTRVEQIQSRFVIFQRGSGDIVPVSTRQ